MTSKASSRKLWWRDKKIAAESILLVLVISFRQAWAIKRFIVSPRIVGPTHLIDLRVFWPICSVLLALFRRKTHQSDRPRDVPRDVASAFQTHYLIIAQTYLCDDVRERDRRRDLFQNCYIFVARRASCRASHVASIVGLVVGLVCGHHAIFSSVVASRD